ncbi:MAG: hypothetical protein OXG53_05805, partial [Chloroflexi bacterium]|nr:hypothetical protein [Chloroflexota bacterium]
GIYPILHLYLENFGLVRDSEVPPTIFAMILGTTLVYATAGPAIRDPHKRAFYISLLSLLFSLSGHVYVMIFMPRSLLIWNVASALGLILLAIALLKWLPRQSYAQFSAPFNLITATMLAIQIITLAGRMVAARNYDQVTTAFTWEGAAQIASKKQYDSSTLPDIYYIIPDGYPSDAWLLSTMNFDNSEFTKALKDRGFVVAERARSNYGASLLSLASILNMRYFEDNPSNFSDLDYLRLSIAASRVARQLQRLGYTYVQFTSYTFSPSPIADINRDFTPSGPIDIRKEDTNLGAKALNDLRQSETAFWEVDFYFRQPFISSYIDTTALRIIRSQLEKLGWGPELPPYDTSAPERFLASIDEVKSIVAMPEATFTIIHLLKPHYPVSFNENGEIIEWNYSPSPDEFFAEFGFTNAKFLEMIDIILEGSEDQPVIIFQADHGSTYGHKKSSDKRFTLFDVYTAYFVPNSFAIDIPPSYTLINTFPLILNEVFGADYALQEDRLIEVPEVWPVPFKQKDVTEEFARN